MVDDHFTRVFSADKESSILREEFGFPQREFAEFWTAKLFHDCWNFSYPRKHPSFEYCSHALKINRLKSEYTDSSQTDPVDSSEKFALLHMLSDGMKWTRDVKGQVEQIAHVCFDDINNRDGSKVSAWI